jgi:hypothetical protein
MAETIKKAAKPSGTALDKGMAGFLAAAVAFVAVAMPDELMPFGAPAGSPARVAVAAGAAIATFLVVFALLRALSKPRRPKGARQPAEVANDPPRLRRADAHPDAPSRSPILAGRELGLPLDEVPIDERTAADLAEIENVDFDAEWERPLPDFIPGEVLPADAEPADWEPVDEIPEPTDFASPSPSPSPVRMEDEPLTVEEEAPPTGSEIPFWVPEGAAPAEPSQDVPAEPIALEEPEPLLAVPFRKPRTSARAGNGAEGLGALAEALPEANVGGPVSEMVERFETGLSRRPRAQAGETELDQRLRSALGDLKKMSGRR